MIKLSRVRNLYFFLFIPLFTLLIETTKIPIDEVVWPVKKVYATNELKMGIILINEVAWMGTTESWQHEWIELYNNTSSEVILDGWKLIAQDGNPEIDLKGTIPENGFFLLERTDDNTLKKVLADQVYRGILNNRGETLELYDSFGNLIDLVSCSQGWLGGNNKTKQTMERRSSQFLGSNFGTWQTSQNIGGTPKAINNLASQEKKETTKNIAAPISLLRINEILPDPQGISDAEGEYIEIFNGNKKEVNVSSWKIMDTVGASAKSYTFPQSTIIGTKEFMVLYRPLTKITLNNTGDGLILFNSEGEIVDFLSYDKKAVKGQSLNFLENIWAWSPILTPGDKNSIPSSTTTQQSKSSSQLPVSEEIFPRNKSEESLKEGLAMIGQQASPSLGFFHILLIALSLSFTSGGIFLILKRKLKNSNF